MSEKAKSRFWWEHIKTLARHFEADLNKKGYGSVRIKLSETKLESALDMYERNWQKFKEGTYGEAKNDNRIDRHKIIAIYMQAFLAEKPFSLSVPENKDMDLHFPLANEFFSLFFMETVITAWRHGEKDADYISNPAGMNSVCISDIFKMEKNEMKWFIILLNHLKLNPKKLDILSLAQIIYYIEKPYNNEE